MWGLVKLNGLVQSNWNVHAFYKESSFSVWQSFYRNKPYLIIKHVVVESTWIMKWIEEEVVYIFIKEQIRVQ